MDLSKLPIIDWDAGIKLAGNKKELAQEILDLFIKSLPQDIQAIKTNYLSNQYQRLQHCVHKLHGALCYCGLPRLKTLIKEIESALKSKANFATAPTTPPAHAPLAPVSFSALPSLLGQLESEVNLLVAHYCKSGN